MVPSALEPHLQDLISRQAEAHGILSRQLFFVASCSKSGSTWLQHILNGHAQIRCHGEAFFPTYLKPLLESAALQYNKLNKIEKYSNSASYKSALTAADISHLYRSAVAAIVSGWEISDDIAAIGEKTPENATSVQELLSDFPGSKIIHLIRDGRDVCVSGWFHNVREKGDEFLRICPSLKEYIPLMAGEKWKQYIQAVRDVQRQSPAAFYEVRYEDLHARPREVIAECLEFIGVESNSSYLDACISAGSFSKLSGGRDIGVEDQNSFYRKGLVGDWREHFDDEAIRAFDAAAGDLARELGYL